MATAKKRKLSGSVDGKPILVKAVLTTVTPPTAPTTALSGTAGICTDGAHTVCITFVTPQGETTIGAAGTARTTAAANNGQINLTAIPVDPLGLATGRNVYMSKAGTTTPFFKVAAGVTIADNVTTTYAVNISDNNLSISPPNVNTAIATALAAPTLPTTALVVTGAGVCTAGAHTVALTYVTPEGETMLGAVGVARTCDANNTKILVTNIPADQTGRATGRNVYMTKAGTTTPFYRVAASPVIPDNFTGTYTIDVADASLTVSPPATNEAIATLIHTAVAGTTPGTFDEIWQWAYNGHTAAVALVIEEGTTELPMTVSVGSKVGRVPIEPGLILQNGNAIRAAASVPNVITIRGFVNATTD